MSSSQFAASLQSPASQPKDQGGSALPSAPPSGSQGPPSQTDWGRRVNGTSTSNTHRRPSLSTTLTHPPTPSHPPTSSSNVYHPPHHYNRAGAAGSTTYPKDELLNIYKLQESGGFLNTKKLDELILSDLHGSGSGSGGGWGRSGDESSAGVEVCWEKDGGLKPVNLEEMSEDERELFSNNVNSPHKVPTNNNQGAPNHHTNHNTPPQNRNSKVGGQSNTTPGSGRPQNRRRETSDAGMTGNPFGATPPQLARRRTDLRENEEKDGGTRSPLFGRWGSTSGPTDDDHGKDKDDGTGGRNTGLFRRGSAAWGSTGGTGFASSGALNSPMGSFGNGAFGGGAMGGFSLGEKSKPGGSAAKATNQPKVEEERTEEETAEKVAAAAVDDFNDDQDRPMTSDTDPYGLSGDHDDPGSRHSPLPSGGIGDSKIRTASPFSAIAPGSTTTPRAGNALGTPSKTRTDLGFAAFGGSHEGLSGSMAGQQHMMGLHQQLRDLQLNQQQGGNALRGRSREGSIGATMAGENEPLSPTETNPYQSPAPEKADEEDMANDIAVGGLGNVIAEIKRGDGSNAAPGSDRSGRSSTAGLGSVGGLGGFGSLGGASLWGGQGTPGGLGTSAAPGSFFGTGVLGDLNSPVGGGGSSLLGSGNIGSVGGLGGGNAFGSAGRASRLGQLFPENQQHDDTPGFEAEPFANVGFGGFGSRRGFGAPMDSPMRERGDVHDLFGLPTTRSLGNIGGVAAAQEAMFARDREDPLATFQHQPQQGQQESPPMGQSQTPGALNSAGQPLRPPPGVQQQQHVMVMPDKMQWVYRDPSGTVQGPFSGLEMHDWYRAGFFTSELFVRRVEDTEFEMLGAMVRRIGNTREPFLVPLPGSNASAGTSTNANNTNRLGSTWLNDILGPQSVAATPTATTQPGAVQPPFAGSFPTFGTTLTAEQQNALERRKQEEQYLMAKQREFLVQQQIYAKQAQQLHHQHSAQSLHSQPSFGSLHSPGSFAGAATPAAPVIPGLGGQNAFEPGVLLRQAGAAAGGVDAFGAGAGGIPGQGQTPGAQFTSPLHQQPSQEQMLQLQQKMADQQKQHLQRSYQLQQQQQVEKQLQQAQEQAHQAIAQVQQQQEGAGDSDYTGDTDEGQERQHAFTQEEEEQQSQGPNLQLEVNDLEPAAPSPVPEQLKSVPRAPSAKTSPAPRTSQPSVWGQPAALVQPFPPAPGTQQDVPIARSPSIDTPSASIAPWAKENENQALKTPSLKEIQEIEAKQAAVREAAEAQARRESLAQQVQAAQNNTAPAPGLPSTATWATSPSTTPTAGASAWNKPLAKAPVTAVGRKTLQQIQKEEEQRKAKAAAAAASQAAMNSTNPQVASVGKRYADLAGKTAQANPTMGGAWTTVGPGGKSKAPTPTAPTGPASTLRPASSVGFPPTAPAAVPKKILSPAPPSAPKSQTATTTAHDEFMKWCRASMKGLNPGVNPDEVITNINLFPSDAELIADTIYTVSNTMDGRRFAEEYMRRQKAAQAGVVIEAGTPSNSGSANGGGWNEVAKGRPQPATPGSAVVPETNSAFKVVAGKKGKSRR